MGGKKGKTKFRNKKKMREERQAAKEPYRGDFNLVTVTQGNCKMEAYYALQGIHHQYFNDKGDLVECQSPEEIDAERLRWRTSIGKILPASFRTAFDVSESLKERLEKELQEIIEECEKERANKEKQAEENGEENKEAYQESFYVDSSNNTSETRTIIHRIPFLPHAYQLGVDRKIIRKDPQMGKLFEWMKRQTAAGFITRQETVSMVPPVVLSPQPNDSVLDMCAAPGSKTCQILEKLSPEGSMIANDASYQRAYMLVTQLRRIMHNNPAVLITSCEAQFFPQQSLSFDRILADVPCSGDGTSRKNIGIWKNWNQLGALALHSLQLDIAWKGVALLKVGGYMCYSTCSHNPIENEAVVSELLRRSKGSLELVDAPLAGFKVRPGMKTWKVLAEEKSMKQIKNEHKKNNAKMKQKRAEWEEKEKKAAGDNPKQGEEEEEKAQQKDADPPTNATTENEETADMDTQEEKAAKADEDVAAKAEQESTNKVETKPSSKPRFEPPASWDDETLIGLAEKAGLKHFKSIDEVPKNLAKRIKPTCFPPTEEEAQQFHLEKCMRCLSQDNDTGGFFVALLKKVAPVSRREARGKHLLEPKDDASEQGPELKRAKLDSDDVADEAVAAEGKGAGGAEGDKGNAVEGTAGEAEGPEDIAGATEMSTKLKREVKANRLDDKQGGKHKDLGRDDFIPVDEAAFGPLIEFYGFDDNFPKDQMMTRACGGGKVLHYIRKSVKENYIDQGIQKRITIIGSGVKAFVRNTNMTSDSMYRVSQEGVQFLLPYMTKRKVVVSLDDFKLCMTGEGNIMVKISDFSEEFSTVLTELPIGPFVVLLKGYETDYARKLLMVMWRCRGTNVNCLVSKVDLEAMRTKLRDVKKEQEPS
ncbi:Multisite-specific tRNA:(cytosine-C(5))-methyltransferase trm4a [Seminavis robusta]|uniref:Multisite-specific tRNA:(Cytosine-C(5))-methyltransferase trm4a n=1 Tax=Seminavis robusta TaxID=568900 RepID=A0A9N8HWR5_9STRA|nr:Multisite-specific tRNA:(cytosine-C(5))-methyltransferase trm4a [Seminavis robusta]|eukprot:Sro2022_g311530.1 Multisite-specific tRNA:(cytosine-C(5))-methyltransferase trm4a (875) ;mRNA; r:13373-15997